MKSIVSILALLCAAATMIADDAYFPIKTKTGGEGLTESESKWYGQSLERMKEPRLPEFAKNLDAEIYRITILPTWGNSIAVRVEKHGELYSLSARRLDGQAGYDPGKLVESKDIALSADVSRTLAALIQNLNFFRMSTDEEGINGKDGEEWVLEGVSRGKYHVVHRWSASSYNPEKRGLAPFVNLYRFLVDRSELSERPKNKDHKLI